MFHAQAKFKDSPLAINHREPPIGGIIHETNFIKIYKQKPSCAIEDNKLHSNERRPVFATPRASTVLHLFPNEPR